MDFWSPVHQAKLILFNSHLVEPTDSTICGSLNMELTQGYFKNHLLESKRHDFQTFSQGKNVFFVCVRNVFLHMDSSALAKKAELGRKKSCPHLGRHDFHPLVQKDI